LEKISLKSSSSFQHIFHFHILESLIVTNKGDENVNGVIVINKIILYAIPVITLLVVVVDVGGWPKWCTPCLPSQRQ